jgi:hypothetical protein
MVKNSFPTQNFFGGAKTLAKKVVATLEKN